MHLIYSVKGTYEKIKNVTYTFPEKISISYDAKGIQFLSPSPPPYPPLPYILDLISKIFNIDPALRPKLDQM